MGPLACSGQHPDLRFHRRFSNLWAPHVPCLNWGGCRFPSTCSTYCQSSSPFGASLYGVTVTSICVNSRPFVHFAILFLSDGIALLLRSFSSCSISQIPHAASAPAASLVPTNYYGTNYCIFGVVVRAAARNRSKHTRPHSPFSLARK